MTKAINIEVLGKKDTRSGFGEGLLELGESDQNVVALTADLKESTKVDGFAKKYPERFGEVVDEADRKAQVELK